MRKKMCVARFQDINKNLWKNRQIIRFVLGMLGFYLVWYLLYDLWLLPDGRVDRWVAFHIVEISSKALRMMGFELFVEGRLLGLIAVPGILLVDGCTGLSAIGLFIGFLIAYPGDWLPRILFMIFGIGVIYLVNIIRISVLVITQRYYPRIFGFTHDYSTTAIFYLVIFGLWMVWINLIVTKRQRNRVTKRQSFEPTGGRTGKKRKCWETE